VPVISIKDQDGKDLLTSELSGEGLGRYFKAAMSLRSAVSLAQVFSKPLAERDGSRTLDLALDADVPVGASGELTIAGGAHVGIGVHGGGSTILAASDLQSPVTVPAGTSYTSLTLEAVLQAGISGAAGTIGFGFHAGTALRYSFFHPFETVADSPTVATAIGTTVQHAVFPADLDDLRALPVGAFVSVAGEGELSFSGSASLNSSANLLASPKLPLVGAAALTHGATVTVDAAWTISGSFELRVSRPEPDRVRLMFYRRKGRSLSVTATTMAGLSATVRNKELLSTLMKAISKDPETDLVALVNAGLRDDTILTIQRAVDESINRSLTVSTQFQLSALSENEALFDYEIDLARLGSEDDALLRDALDGRLSAIDARAADPAAPIRVLSSALRQLKQRKTRWRINLLGILNFASFVDLVREGTVMFDPASGALTAADKATASRIQVTSRPLESDGEKLRRVLFESVMITAAYQASRALGAHVSLSAEQIYVEQHAPTKRHDLEDHYRVLVALGLCESGERDARLGQIDAVGASTFAIQNRFDAAACDAVFLTADGKPRPMADYERLGRDALLALLPADDPHRGYRRLALEPDATWRQVRELGGAIDTNLPEHIRGNPLKLNVVRGDVVTVVWWARAMSRAAQELVEMRSFLANRDAATLAASKEFGEARAQLSKALSAVVSTTEARFDDPWEVLAMDAAADRKGTLEASIVSDRFAARYTDEGQTIPAPSVAPVSRGDAAAPMAPRPAKAVRDWTEEERAIFHRHAVNLRGGRLSTDGSFTSTEDQVARIFTEHIPEYVRRQRAAGRQARVLFYAHGGLTSEGEGLLPVLFRRRFWEMNGIYPVHFVWETGLLETVKDLVQSAVPARAERGALIDAGIERAARAGGRVVWGRMKSSAEKAAAAEGGSASVARLAGELWGATNGEIEFHAVGHSAGAIFHAFFLPLLVAQRPAGVPPVQVRTLHFLAPAITNDLFKSQLLPLIGPNRPIQRLTEYTMTDEREQADASMKPYGKSLLYLVSNAFEDAQPTPILGLQKSLKSDLQLIRFFGIAGTQRMADITYSTTDQTTPINARTESITHGGFDNDVATMTSVVRRVLQAPDTTDVVEYFEDEIPGFARTKPARSASEIVGV
jgi:hypothetical protein